MLQGVTHETSQGGRGLLPLVIGLVSLLLAIGVGAWLLGGPGPHAPPPPPPGQGSRGGEAELSPARVVLAPVTSRTAVLWLEGRRLGKLTVGPQGKVQGDALIHAPARAARLGAARQVDLLRPPELDREVADAVQRMFVRSGARRAQVVEVDQVDARRP